MRTTKILLFITLSLSAFSQCALVYNPFTNQFNCGGASGTVGGASNLTTVGAIPYVSAAGVLNQDPAALFWDAANNYLYAGGYTSPSSYSVRLGPAAAEISLRSGSGFIAHSGAALSIGSVSDSGIYLNDKNYSTALNIRGNTGNVLIGTTTDSNFKLDVATSGSAGTMRVYDATATFGRTQFLLASGANQSTVPLLQIQSATYGVRWDPASGPIWVHAALDLLAFQTRSLGLGSSGVFAWSNTADSPQNTKDLSLSRASAGVLQVGDGAANANGQVSATRVLHVGVTVSALPTAAAGNAGSIQYVTDANATTIGSTVAGGGANKVMVWSDGAAWKIFAN